MANTTAWEERVASSSIGDLVSEVAKDLSTLMRQEVELAKAELRDSATQAGRGAGMLGGAAYAASSALLFLSISAWWALGEQIGNGWSALVVALVWAVIGLVMYLVGRKALASVKGAPKTVETVKSIPDTLKKDGH